MKKLTYKIPLVEVYPDYHKKKPTSKLREFFSGSFELPSVHERSRESLIVKQQQKIGELQQENEILRKAMHLLTK